VLRRDSPRTPPSCAAHARWPLSCSSIPWTARGRRTTDTPITTVSLEPRPAHEVDSSSKRPAATWPARRKLGHLERVHRDPAAGESRRVGNTAALPAIQPPHLRSGLLTSPAGSDTYRKMRKTASTTPCLGRLSEPRASRATCPFTAPPASESSVRWLITAPMAVGLEELMRQQPDCRPLHRTGRHRRPGGLAARHECPPWTTWLAGHPRALFLMPPRPAMAPRRRCWR